jgi:hypothetical protein
VRLQILPYHDMRLTTCRCFAWLARVVRSSFRIGRIIAGLAHWRMRAVDWRRGAKPRTCFDFCLMHNAGCQCPPVSDLLLHLATPTCLRRMLLSLPHHRSTEPPFMVARPCSPLIHPPSVHNLCADAYISRNTDRCHPVS